MQYIFPESIVDVIDFDDDGNLIIDDNATEEQKKKFEKIKIAYEIAVKENI